MFSPNPQRSDLIAVVTTSKKREKKHLALDSGEDSPSERHRENTSPDRAVDLTKKGLEALQGLMASIKARCSIKAADRTRPPQTRITKTGTLRANHECFHYPQSRVGEP